MSEVIGIDHIYIAVSNLTISEQFYDKVLVKVLGFRKNAFELNGDPHVQYFNKHFGYVIRPAKVEFSRVDGTPGLHHFCFRVESISEVQDASQQLRNAGIEASEAQQFPEYAPDYWATFFTDPDGVMLEVTNYRQERRDRNEHWDTLG
jgi:catechol 2,3-dioxygenase-like lactoylglutathione lyase family enzyme